MNNKTILNTMEDEELTYEILVEEFRRQDRLIAEGKMQRTPPTDGLSEEGWAIVNEGWTLEKVINEIEGRYKKK
jgi:hypothetical protein